VTKRRDGAIAGTTTLTVASGKLTDTAEIPIAGGGSFQSITVYEKQ